MSLDINSFVVAGGSELVLGASGTKLDSGGRVVIPNNPALSGMTAIDGTVVSEYPQQVNSTVVNTGAWTGNTTFTAPVAGLYFVSSAMITNGTGNNTVATTIQSIYVGIVKNGVLYAFMNYHTNDGWSPALLQTLVYLAVGDTIKIAVNTAPCTVGTSAGMYRSNHNSLVITLIG
jgi:hypothetical protein